MFFPESQVRIWLYTQPTDMRKSYNGLSALVKNTLQDNPLSGELFVFVNRRQNQMKILYFDRSGYCIWSKRLEQGQFVVRNDSRGKKELNWTQLKLLLDGFEIKKIHPVQAIFTPQVRQALVKYGPCLPPSPALPIPPIPRRWYRP